MFERTLGAILAGTAMLLMMSIGLVMVVPDYFRYRRLGKM